MRGLSGSPGLGRKIFHGQEFHPSGAKYRTLDAPSIRVKHSFYRPTCRLHHRGLVFRGAIFRGPDSSSKSFRILSVCLCTLGEGRAIRRICLPYSGGQFLCWNLRVSVWHRSRHKPEHDPPPPHLAAQKVQRLDFGGALVQFRDAGIARNLRQGVRAYSADDGLGAQSWILNAE